MKRPPLSSHSCRSLIREEATHRSSKTWSELRQSFAWIDCRQGSLIGYRHESIFPISESNENVSETTAGPELTRPFPE